MDRPYHIAIVGLGKMGISHLAIANATPGLKVVAVCDSSTLIGGMVGKYSNIAFYDDYEDTVRIPGLDGLIIATPTRLHVPMIRTAIAHGLHVFCEKPMTLSAAESADLAALMAESGRTGQVGYHNRFVGTFAEAKRLIDSGAVGTVRHVHAEAYGPVVLKPAGRTWRSTAAEGGGCLYDYAAHPINLMNWFLGRPVMCAGAQLTRQWSREVDDAAYANLLFTGGASGQLSVNWSDETARKMTTRVTIWADHGKIIADRQELQVFVGASGRPSPEYRPGWTVRYITDLTPHPAFYLRGEEYSEQLEHFARAMSDPAEPHRNDFASAADTDLTLEMIRNASQSSRGQAGRAQTDQPVAARRRLGLFGRATGGR